MFFLSSPFKGETDSRMYVQLMWKASSQYAPFTPSAIELGDYGHIDRSSGAFIREGNVLAIYPGLTHLFQNVRETEEEVRIFKHTYRERAYQDLQFTAAAGDIADAKIKAGWRYDKNRLAALIIVNPVFVQLAHEGELYKTLTQNKELKGKAVVTQLVKCTTYAVLLTNGASGTAYAGFHTEAATPVGSPVTVSAGGGTNMVWRTECDSGTWSTAKYESGVYRHTPLCTLRSIRRKNWANIRGAPAEEDAENTDVMLDYYPPWNDLKEDGSEDSDEDDYSDEDDSDENGEKEEDEE